MTSSGGVRADRIAGPLKVRTSSGTIAAGELSGTGADARSDSDVSTGSGARDITLPTLPTLPATPSAPARLAVRTSSGGIRISAF